MDNDKEELPDLSECEKFLNLFLFGMMLGLIFYCHELKFELYPFYPKNLSIKIGEKAVTASVF